jgi:hypothetical protein
MSKESHFRIDGKSGLNNTPEKGERKAGFSSHISLLETDQLPERLRGQSGGLAGGRELPAEPLFKSQREFKEWCRWDNHKRWIFDFLVEDVQHTVSVLLTFDRYVSKAHAKSVARRVVTRWLSRFITHWVKVFERGAGGIHVHLLVRLAAGLSVETGLEQIEVEIRRRARCSDHLAQCDAEAVQSVERASAYLTKTLSKEGRGGRVRGFAITYSQNISRRPWWLARGDAGRP